MAIGMGAAKYCQLALFALHEDYYIFSILLSALTCLIALYTSTAFIALLGKFDVLVLLGSYYVWLVMYQLPLGVTALGVDVNWDFSAYAGVTIAATLTSLGTGYIAYVRASDIETEGKLSFERRKNPESEGREDSPMVGN